MRETRPMSISKLDMQAIVREGYEKIDYEKSFRLHEGLKPLETEFFGHMCSLLSPGARVLDLGCGPGVPYDLHLARLGYSVTGVDFCQKHLGRARKLVPQERFICGDISEVLRPNESFNAVLSLYTIFHLPRVMHKEMFRVIHRALKPGGISLLTLGTSDLELGEEDDFLGERMVWSSFLPSEYETILEETELKILRSRFEGSPEDEEYHWWILVQKS